MLFVGDVASPVVLDARRTLRAGPYYDDAAGRAQGVRRAAGGALSGDHSGVEKGVVEIRADVGALSLASSSASRSSGT
jgi:hypothetical protein